MSVLLEKNTKNKLIGSALAKAGIKETSILKLAQIALDSLSIEEIKSFSSKDIANMISSLHSFSKIRAQEEIKVRVFNPSDQKMGWDIERTVIEVAIKNVPFVIDSITAEINRNDFLVHTILHPMVSIERDKKGTLQSFEKYESGADREQSEILVHLQLTRQLSAKVIKEMTQKIEKVMHDVLAATSDWQKMTTRMQETIDNLESNQKVIKNNKTSAKHRIEEAIHFLKYMIDNHYTFLGYREYNFINTEGTELSSDSGLGILRNKDFVVLDGYRNLKKLPPEVMEFRQRPNPMFVRKSTMRSTVHRDAAMDILVVKKYDNKGAVIGECVFAGLFTSTVYAQSVLQVPYIRRKAKLVLEESGFPPNTHDYKALLDILERYPTDELFQSSQDVLFSTAISILRLKERSRVALFCRRDHLERFCVFTVYIPRDNFNSRLREQIQNSLEEAVDGSCNDFYTTLDDSALARIIYIINKPSGRIAKFDREKLEEKITRLAETWSDKMLKALTVKFGSNQAADYMDQYQGAFQESYKTNVKISHAVRDIEKIEELIANGNIVVDLYESKESRKSQLFFKVYHKKTPMSLSDIVPILENMGLKGVKEEPYEVIIPNTKNSLWVHDFQVECYENCITDIAQIKYDFEETFIKIWHKQTANDLLNSLVITGGLKTRQIDLLRVYARYLKQAASVYSREMIKGTLCHYPVLSRLFVEYFTTRFDPEFKGHRDSKLKDIRAEIDKQLSFVKALSEDNILRDIINVLENTLRTNFFQFDKNKKSKPYISIKIDSQQINALPLPKPYKEIFVHGPDVEGIHLRGGPIARGGLRWSDRADDYRTEVLGLMKAQMVKNSVIVPVGSKGGFVLQKDTKAMTRSALQEEGIRCYKIFISGLLDVTDNLIDGDVVSPDHVIRYDGDDPYLVVAADKGTATFSDIANGKSKDYGFWLGDAFASGGSAGYDHKKMGITAKGGWESVKRHFREIGIDIQNEDFTVVGVGDMSGDVFGNAMLLSPHIKLLGAFNHLHIFCDPNPDTQKSFEERERLFKMLRSQWADYNEKLLSKGGRIFERSAKSLELTTEIQNAFGLHKKEVTPNELIKAILRSKVNLLWFGGIGTYVKASSESDSQVGDRTNDALRIEAKEIRAQVIGEGANLGMTQKGRIEYALNGGRLNADFIDNSAGVDCSDHEVNIKILMADIVNDKKLTVKKRNTLLSKMEKTVSALVLKNNYQQTQAISLSESMAMEYIESHAALIRHMEKKGLLNRDVEFLPDDEELDNRSNLRKGLTRPELAVLTSYTKMNLFNALLETELPEQEIMHKDWLLSYFPQDLQEEYEKEICNHKLKRQIIATELAGSIVNRMGFAFMKLKNDKIGATADQVARAYVIVKDICDLKDYWTAIESLDNKVSADTQYDMMIDVTRWADRLISWFLMHEDKNIDIEYAIKNYKSGVQILKKKAEDLISPEMRSTMKKRKNGLIKRGVPEKLAEDISLFPALSSACELIRIGHDSNQSVESIAQTYYMLGNRLYFDWLRYNAKILKQEGYWQAMALTGMVDDLYACQASLAKRIVIDKKNQFSKQSEAKKIVDCWLKTHHGFVEQLDEHVKKLKRMDTVNLAMLTIADQKLRTLSDTNK